MVRVLNRKSFRLPYVKPEKFSRILRLGLGYNSNKRSYYIKNYENIEKIMDTICEIIGEKISFLQICVLCGIDFSCSNCKYASLCQTRDLPLSCICSECLNTENLHHQYSKG